MNHADEPTDTTAGHRSGHTDPRRVAVVHPTPGRGHRDEDPVLGAADRLPAPQHRRPPHASQPVPGPRPTSPQRVTVKNEDPR